MKKMLLILALSVFGFANAQKGTVLVGGNVGYTSQTVDYGVVKFKTDAFEFSPRVGYQFHDNWTVGGEFTLSSSKQQDENSNGEAKLNANKFGAFVRYTMPLNETFSVFADLGAGFQNQKTTTDDGTGNSTIKADGFYAGITPALFINMKKGFGLNFSIGGLGYESLSFDNDGPDVKSFGFNFGKTVNIGISKNF
ncbi:MULTISPECIES: outer membrane beta-barrel protein [Flavobacterium]|uniref:outer membrane beta-barrel protein n=1 Tax=Flavobacterium TaxID=237 RepID=UPI001181DC4A|nr:MULTISPECIES: outer membrane beta-barrel protein [Flavobacterium]MCR4031664.1 porin family protein [Flavobacterium panacis]